MNIPRLLLALLVAAGVPAVTFSVSCTPAEQQTARTDIVTAERVICSDIARVRKLELVTGTLPKSDEPRAELERAQDIVCADVARRGSDAGVPVKGGA